MAKESTYTITEIIKSKAPRLEFISGKWFNNEKEIKNIYPYIAEIYPFRDKAQMDSFIDYFTAIYGTKGLWYDSEIITQAVINSQLKQELKPLSYPLSEKELIMFKIILYYPNEEVSFIMSGVGGSGKSTIGNILCQIFENDVSYTSLDDLSNPFNVAEACKHRLIYSSELSAESLDSKIYKKLVSREGVHINPKNNTPYDITAQSAMLFCCNVPPQIDVKDTGVLRRLVYYFKNTKIENPDAGKARKKYTKEELINFAQAAYEVDIKGWEKKFEKETHELLVTTSTVGMYMLRTDNPTYEDYKEFCHQFGYKSYNFENYKIRISLFRSWGYGQ